MNPYRKAMTFVIRLIALGFILLPLILFGLDFFAAKAHQAAPTGFATAIKICLVVFGVVLFFASSTIARNLTKDLDE